tara:strand:+ start:1162 stop:1569 length:408 start_codon:yes stop_codon:yes gene_type:complete
MNLEHEIKKLNAIIEEYLVLDSINTKSKTKEEVLGRMVAANILMDYHLTPAMLSNYYKKDRTTFNHYRKRHNEYMTFPKSYPEYIQLYEHVQVEYIKRARNVNVLSKLQRAEVLDSINRNIDELIERRQELLQTL